MEYGIFQEVQKHIGLILVARLDQLDGFFVGYKPTL